MSITQAFKEVCRNFLSYFTNATDKQMLVAAMHIFIICAVLLITGLSDTAVVLLTLYFNVVWAILPDSEDKMAAAAATAGGCFAMGLMTSSLFVFFSALIVAVLYTNSILEMLQKIERKRTW